VSFPLPAIILLSLDVTRGLVVLGYGLGYDTDAAEQGVYGRFTRALAPSGSATATPGSPYPSLRIVDCTGHGVSPIVITTEYPHGVSGRVQGCGGMSCIIDGVLGNTAANNIDANPKSETCGLPAGTLAVPLSTTTLALYGQDPTYGNLVALTGNGAYTSGGTITPALGDGSILIGRDTAKEQSSPPRIVLIPRAVQSIPREASMPAANRNIERRAEIQQRSVGSDVWAFDVHAWGQSQPPDAANDFIAASALRDCIRYSLNALACGTSSTDAGVWDDEKALALTNIKAGHLLSFGITIKTPVLRNMIVGGLPFVPSGTVAAAPVGIGDEVSAVIEVPITPR
jgi:hypothetical protein